MVIQHAASVMEQADTEYEITASKVNHGEFGFDICYDETNQEPGYYISTAQVPSLVLRGHVKPGDRIIRMNGTDVTDLDPVRFMDLLCESPDVCTFILKSGKYNIGKETRLRGAIRGRLEDHQGGRWVRDAMERNRFGTGQEVTVKIRKKSGSFGFNISSFARTEGRHEAQRYYVSDIASEDAAERLCLGDEILSINGTSTAHKKHHEVVELFLKAPGKSVLQVMRSRWTSPRELHEQTEDKA